MYVSVIIPVFNEEENIRQLFDELVKALENLDGEYELVFVNDCSSDGTQVILDELSAGAPSLAPIHLTQRSGQSCAMLTGFSRSRGDVLVTMDGDLQNNPADIPSLLSEISEADVVCGYRANRKDSWSRRAGSRIGNRVRNWVTGDGIRDTGCSLKAFRKECADDLPHLNGVHRFMPAYFKLHGRSIREIAVDHRPRVHGTSKYTNFGRLPGTVLDLIGFYWYRKRLVKIQSL